MDETSATITVKKVADKKKKEEEEVEETIEIEEEKEGEVKKGPFGVLLTKAKQNKSVISVSLIGQRSERIILNVHVANFYVNCSQDPNYSNDLDIVFIVRTYTAAEQ